MSLLYIFSIRSKINNLFFGPYTVATLYGVTTDQLMLLNIKFQVPVHELPKTKQELIRNFVEFIQDDKEIGPLLDKMNADQQLIRNRRQSEDGGASVEGNSEVEPAQPSEGGFFDRAAKFVMEVLQRFLKWINSDN